MSAAAGRAVLYAIIQSGVAQPVKSAETLKLHQTYFISPHFALGAHNFEWIRMKEPSVSSQLTRNFPFPVCDLSNCSFQTTIKHNNQTRTLIVQTMLRFTSNNSTLQVGHLFQGFINGNHWSYLKVVFMFIIYINHCSWYSSESLMRMFFSFLELRVLRCNISPSNYNKPCSHS